MSERGGGERWRDGVMIMAYDRAIPLDGLKKRAGLIVVGVTGMPDGAIKRRLPPQIAVRSISSNVTL